MSEKSESAFGRRDIIKKTAVVGAVAWTAPLIVSSRVMAQVPSDEAGPLCDRFYVVKIDGSPTLGTLFCELNKGYVQVTDTSQVVSNGSYSEATGGCFTLTSDVTLISVIGKKRQDECNNLTPASIPGAGGTYCVEGGQSHIMVVVCSSLVFSGRVINEGIASRALPPEDSSTQSSTVEEPAAVVEEPAAVVEEPAAVVENPAAAG